jgi:hypothetical protein
MAEQKLEEVIQTCKRVLSKAKIKKGAFDMNQFCDDVETLCLSNALPQKLTKNVSFWLFVQFLNCWNLSDQIHEE